MNEKRRFQNIEDVRRYIAGEQFDPAEHERQHIQRLTETVNRMIEESKSRPDIYLHNAIITAKRYCENHKDTQNKKEYKQLVAAYNKLCEINA